MPPPSHGRHNRNVTMRSFLGSAGTEPDTTLPRAPDLRGMPTQVRGQLISDASTDVQKLLLCTALRLTEERARDLILYSNYRYFGLPVAIAERFIGAISHKRFVNVVEGGFAQLRACVESVEIAQKSARDRTIPGKDRVVAGIHQRLVGARDYPDQVAESSSRWELRVAVLEGEDCEGQEVDRLRAVYDTFIALSDAIGPDNPVYTRAILGCLANSEFTGGAGPMEALQGGIPLDLRALFTLLRNDMESVTAAANIAVSCHMLHSCGLEILATAMIHGRSPDQDPRALCERLISLGEALRLQRIRPIVCRRICEFFQTRAPFPLFQNAAADSAVAIVLREGCGPETAEVADELLPFFDGRTQRPDFDRLAALTGTSTKKQAMQILLSNMRLFDKAGCLDAAIEAVEQLELPEVALRRAIAHIHADNTGEAHNALVTRPIMGNIGAGGRKGAPVKSGPRIEQLRERAEGICGLVSELWVHENGAVRRAIKEVAWHDELAPDRTLTLVTVLKNCTQSDRALGELVEATTLSKLISLFVLGRERQQIELLEASKGKDFSLIAFLDPPPVLTGSESIDLGDSICARVPKRNFRRIIIIAVGLEEATRAEINGASALPVLFPAIHNRTIEFDFQKDDLAVIIPHAEHLPHSASNPVRAACRRVGATPYTLPRIHFSRIGLFIAGVGRIHEGVRH